MGPKKNQIPKTEPPKRQSARIREQDRQLIDLTGQVPTVQERAQLLAQRRDENLNQRVRRQRSIMTRAATQIQANPYAQPRINYRNIQRDDDGRIISVEKKTPIKKKSKKIQAEEEEEIIIKKSSKKETEKKKKIEIEEDSEDSEERIRILRKKQRQQKKKKQIESDEDSEEEEKIIKKEKVSLKEEKSKKKIWLISSEVGNSDERSLYYNYLSYTNPRTQIVPVKSINIQTKFDEFKMEMDEKEREIYEFINVYANDYNIDIARISNEITYALQQREGNQIQLLQQVFIILNDAFVEYEQFFFTREIFNHEGRDGELNAERLHQNQTREIRDDLYNVFDRSRDDTNGNYFSSRLAAAIFLRRPDVSADVYQQYFSSMKDFLCQDMTEKYNLEHQFLPISRENDDLQVIARTLVDWSYGGYEQKNEFEEGMVFTQNLFVEIVNEFNQFLYSAGRRDVKLANIIQFAGIPIRSLLRYVNLIFMVIYYTDDELTRKFLFAFFHPSLSRFSKDNFNMITIWQVLGHDYFCKLQACGLIKERQKQNYVGSVVYKSVGIKAAREFRNGVQLSTATVKKGKKEEIIPTAYMEKEGDGQMNAYKIIQFQNLGRNMNVKCHWEDTSTDYRPDGTEEFNQYNLKNVIWGNPKFTILMQYFSNQLVALCQAQELLIGRRSRVQQFDDSDFTHMISISNLIIVYHCEMERKQAVQTNRHYKIYNQKLFQKILTFLAENKLILGNPDDETDMSEIDEYFLDADDLFFRFDNLSEGAKFIIAELLLKYIICTSIYGKTFTDSIHFVRDILRDEVLLDTYNSLLTYVCRLAEGDEEVFGSGSSKKKEGEDDYDEQWGSGIETVTDPLSDLIMVHFFGQEPSPIVGNLTIDLFTFSLVKSSAAFCSKAAARATRVRDEDGDLVKGYSIQRRINAILIGKQFYENFSDRDMFQKPLKYFSIQKLPPLAEKTFIPLALRPYICKIFQKIEQIHKEKNCVQILAIFLFYISNLIDETLAQEDTLVEKFLNIAGLNQNAIFQILELIQHVQQQFQEQIPNTVLLRVQIINFDQECLTYEQFQNAPREIINIPIHVKDQYQNLLIIIFRGHIMPIYDEKGQNLKTIWSNLSQNSIIKQIEQVQKLNLIQRMAAGSLKQIENQNTENLYDDYKKINSLEESQAFYRKYYQELKLKGVQAKGKVLIFYDIETTVKLRDQIEPSDDMIPYVLVFEVVTVGVDLSKVSDYDKDFFFTRPVQAAGGGCTRQFVTNIGEIYRILVEAKVTNFEIIVLGWNSAKFDVQFLLPHLYQQFPLEMDLVGVPSNPKCLSLGKKVKFWDAMQVCSRQTLQSFCNSMGVEGKMDCPEIFEIRTMADAQANIPRLQKIVAYCTQDVQAMRQAVMRFNEKIVKLISDFRGQEPQKDIFILQQTIASTSFKNFTKYLIPPQLIPQPLNEEEALDAARQSYRGGYVQCFAFGNIKAQPEDPKSFVHRITYIDINSLYPSIMDKLPLPIAIENYQAEDFVEIFRGKKYDYNFKCQNLYQLESFILPKFMCYGFFPIRIFDKSGNFQKIIYPLEWTGNKNQQSLWVWGHELACLVEIIRRGLKGRIPADNEIRLSFLQMYSYEIPKKIFPHMGLLYKERLKHKALKDIPMADTTKTQMNSLYGKFGQNAYATYFYMNDFMVERLQDDDFDQLLQLNFLQKSQCNMEKLKNWFPRAQTYKFANSTKNLYRYPVMEQNSYIPHAPQQRLVYISSQIANAARCILLATLYTFQMSGQFLPLYSDTDSIIYGSTSEGQQILKAMEENPVLLENQNFPLHPISWRCQNVVGSDYLQASVKFSGQLGDMKIEKDEISQVKLFAPKFYRVYDKNGKSEDKSKGVNLRMRLDLDEKLSNEKNQAIKDKLFDDFEKDLMATVFQNQIISKNGQMIQGSFNKQLTFNLTRKIEEKNNNNIQLATIFKNQEEYQQYLEKKLVKQNDFYFYQ